MYLPAAQTMTVSPCTWASAAPGQAPPQPPRRPPRSRAARRQQGQAASRQTSRQVPAWWRRTRARRSPARGARALRRARDVGQRMRRSRTMPQQGGAPRPLAMLGRLRGRWRPQRRGGAAAKVAVAAAAKRQRRAPWRMPKMSDFTGGRAAEAGMQPPRACLPARPGRRGRTAPLQA